MIIFKIIIKYLNNYRGNKNIVLLLVGVIIVVGGIIIVVVVVSDF